MNRPRVVGPTALAAVAVVLVGALLHVGHLPGPPRPAAAPPSVRAPATTSQATVDRAGRGGRTAAALRLLRAWDAQRAAAYAAGSPRRLAALYTPGSRAGSADVRLLAAYRARGFHVVGMRTQLLRFEVLRADASRWVLRVEDRLARAVAVGRRQRVPLPRDETSTRTLTLLRARGGRWQVSLVADG